MENTAKLCLPICQCQIVERAAFERSKQVCFDITQNIFVNAILQ